MGAHLGSTTAMAVGRFLSSLPIPDTSMALKTGPPNSLTLTMRTTIGYGAGPSRLSVIVEARKSRTHIKKEDTYRSIPKPDEATGPFPESVLLKEKKVREDGRVLPEFADDDEEKLYEYLNLELESQSNVERMRHYEVVYLIHSKHEEDVGSVNEKVQEFLRENKGKVWRFSDWGMRRLAYPIQKAYEAHYVLMNFEIEAKLINEFKTMLDKDERVIRHLVIKRDQAITEECPPPPEFHTLRAEDFEDDDDFYDDDDDEYDSEFEDDDNVIVVPSDVDQRQLPFNK